MIIKIIVRARKNLFIVAVFATLISLVSTAYSEGIIIDHTCTDINQVPEYWVNQAKDVFKVSYGHTSHGSQIVTGMDMVINQHGALYEYDSVTSSCPFDSAFLCDRYPSGDLGNPDRTTWAQLTRDLLNNANNDRNLIIWSWCGQHDTTATNINLYLTQMNQLELDYPDVTFVYMTGHLNEGSGPPDGNTFLRNEQIRQYCLDNNKILFDFADIESWDPNGNDHRDDDDACNWCADWCSTHNCPSCSSCAHSHCFNCYQKGKAFWWMMARLAGWNTGSTSTTSIMATTSSTTTIESFRDNCVLLKIYDEDSEEIELLRYVRDNLLNQTHTGKELIRLYYVWSPVIVKTMEADEDFKGDVKEMIDELLMLIEEGIE